MGTIRLMGDVSGFVDIKSGDTPASGALTLPPSGGANNQVLTSNGANKQVWTNPSALEGFRGIVRSHPDSDSVNSKIRADLSEVVFSNGKRFVPAQGLVFDKSGTGSINGMQAAAAVSTWNKLYYLRKSSDGSEGLWGLRAKNYLNDTSFTTTRDGSPSLRLLTGTPSDKLAQGFQLATAGKVEFVDVGIIRANTPTGNVWFTIEADSAGNPSGTPLATSDKYDVSRLGTASGNFVRVPFRSPATLSAATQYHLVFQGDYAKSETVVAQWDGVIAGGYASGSAKQFNGTTWSAAGVGDFRFKIYVTQNDTVISPPSGYDQSVQIGWFYIDGSGNIKPFFAMDKRIDVGGDADWKIGTHALNASILFDISAFVPPITTSVLFGVAAGASSTQGHIGRLTATDLSFAAEWHDVVTYTTPAGTGVNGVRSERGPLPIEYQGVMLSTDTNTVHHWIRSITW